MKCDDCQYADWRRTSNGRLHPDKTGMCRFKKAVKIPASRTWRTSQSAVGDEIVIEGGYIQRGREISACPYFGRGK